MTVLHLFTQLTQNIKNDLFLVYLEERRRGEQRGLAFQTQILRRYQIFKNINYNTIANKSLKNKLIGDKYF